MRFTVIISVIISYDDLLVTYLYISSNHHMAVQTHIQYLKSHQKSLCALSAFLPSVSLNTHDLHSVHADFSVCCKLNRLPE